MMTDGIADMLTRIRNAGMASAAETRCPASKLKRAVADVLVEEGYLDSAWEEQDERGRNVLCLKLRLREDGSHIIDGIERVSRPSRRVYVGVRDIPKVRNGLGIAVMSTPGGVVSDRTARSRNIGGEVLCKVW